jgi:hypothetical protein
MEENYKRIVKEIREGRLGNGLDEGTEPASSGPEEG